LINPLEKIINNPNIIDTFVHKEVQAVNNNASIMPAALANLTTGMDIYQIDLKKLIPAPKDWNFYSPLSDAKMFELMNSIYSNGLLNPIIIWELGKNKYMILSGHNRVDAYKRLNELFTKVNSDEAVNYNKIHAMIFRKDTLDEEDAKQIIIDTNWVQRMLTPIEKQKSIFHKYASMGRKQRAKNGESNGERIRDIIGREFNISGRQISKYIKLNSLIEQFKDIVDRRKINIHSGTVLADFDREIQEWIYINYKNELNNKKINRLNTKMNKEEIAHVFTNKDDTNKNYFKTRNLFIPIKLKEKFIEHIYNFYCENELLKEFSEEEDFAKKIIVG
jgi:ParB family chromosome partitioning protein